MAKTMDFGGRTLDMTQPHVMGILNITPDSFSDGGQLFDDGVHLSAVLDRAAHMVEEGASFLDVGGESTRPGAAPVSVQEEMDRVLPVVEALVQRFDVVVSVDTSTPEVIAAVRALGAGLINDVRALSREGALVAAAATGLPVCLMHMQGQPGSMQAAPQYTDPVAEVSQFLVRRMQACEQAGIARGKILLDPGFGFGKTLEHNLALFNALPQLAAEAPVLVGVSRKTMIGQLCSRTVDQRMAGSLALALLAMQRGAAILRVHDVAETADVVKVWRACRIDGS